MSLKIGNSQTLPPCKKTNGIAEIERITLEETSNKLVGIHDKNQFFIEEPMRGTHVWF